MANFKQITLCLFLFILSNTTYGIEPETETKDEKEELVESESKDGKLEIIKRIKKINDDGSYTIGYEADDGSFKIESRDVLGHIKGTYGFLDDEGQIKRVSYSTSNSSEIITKPESPSVVQRIPNKNKTTSTKRPITTQSTPASTSNTVVQSIARRRATSTSTTSTSTTTQKPNYSDVINVSSRTTSRPNQVTYTSAPPRVLLQGRPSVSSTVAMHTHTIKSEGQLIRPEIVTVRPTELPLYRRLALKHLEDDKPVTEDSEPEVRGNILRRQLSQENTREYNLQEHLYSLQQSLGHDATDVYSASVTTGTPRPLFTTTNRPRAIPISTTASTPEAVPRPTVRYPLNYHRNVLQDLERNTPEYTQETTTNQPVNLQSTPTPVPVVQIPANRVENQEPLVAIKHPFQRGTILVPLSQLQGRIIPIENMREIDDAQKEYDSQSEQYFRETTTKSDVAEFEQQRAVVRRLPPPQLRPMPVQVDENGFIREVPRHGSSSYPIPVPITPAPRYNTNNVENDVDNIEPPVSIRDFQKLLQQLVIRQSRLERISALSRQPQIYSQPTQRYKSVYSHPNAYILQKESVTAQNGPVQFIQQRPEQNTVQQRLRPRQFFEVAAEQQPQAVRHQSQNTYEGQYDPQSYVPNRRVARLLPSASQRQQDVREEYLPPDVREMLLLRMLQLAINPSLPVDSESMELPAESALFKRMPMRNVEILGEEEEPERPKRRPERTKRYRESEIDYE
ncbi:hypothetical protein NQ314_001216 [Rhamnusium bicolor]|uniref:Uncharacterized protein n=1 Tax=Rhamnusium bicolor TaxID=1586634 RepID=A0AAV8ZUV9_9CUCU|nr:hypothetical protein NQ314_001216 [Rhamnusium bicolor]